MTPTKRIFLNAIATYGRSVFALVCGLFTARWVLMVLGEVDYGLYGVVGGLTAFVTFLNGLLATAVGRFYAYAVGEAKKPGNEKLGLDECRRWFNTALFLHTVVPVLLISFGYPAGVWAIERFLTIPVDRIAACIWVWRCCCVTCFVSMVNVPYQAMYTAKQNIAELTIYSFVSTALNVCVLYYMVTHPSDWLTRYAGWMMLMVIVPQIIIGIRAHFIYPECKFHFPYLVSWRHLRPILSFSGFRLLNGLSMIGANQGQSVIVNKYLGPSANAAMSIGNQVAAQSQTLAAAFAGALYPAITNAAGEGRLELMRKLAYRTSKFGVLAILLFTIPLCLEIRQVLDLWLKNPPPFSAELCSCILIMGVLEKLTEGHWMAVFAIGKIAGYQTAACVPSFIALILGWIFVAHGGGVVGVGVALVLSKIFTNVVRLYFGKTVADMSVWYWVRNVFAPIVLVSMIGTGVGFCVRSMIEPSFWRIVYTMVAVESALLPSVWILALDREERDFIVGKIKCRLKF